jgi:hypothetical protein
MKISIDKGIYITDSDGKYIETKNKSFLPIKLFEMQFYVISWIEVSITGENKIRSMCELFDSEGNGLSKNHYQCHNVRRFNKNEQG